MTRKRTAQTRRLQHLAVVLSFVAAMAAIYAIARDGFGDTKQLVYIAVGLAVVSLVVRR